jgi:nucleotide-binding universal stress UspA family protein
VLAACDFSMASAAALAAARRVAALQGGELFALHVIPSTIPPAARSIHALPNPALLHPGARGATLHVLRWLIGRAEGGAVRAHALVEEGRPADVVLEEAARLSADLVVIGKHGRGALARALIGSTAEAVLRRARCPVLFVPPAFAITASWPRTALWATDFSRPASEALAYASAVLAVGGARLAGVHALSARPPARRRAAACARRRLRVRIPAGSRAEVVEAGASAAGAVLAAARLRRPDLLVIGATGRGRLASTLFGSTARDIVRSAACPVLVGGRAAAATNARTTAASANPSARRHPPRRLSPDHTRTNGRLVRGHVD